MHERTPRIGFILLAVAAASWIPGFLNYGMMLYALTCAMGSVGFALAAFGKVRLGLAFPALMALIWVVGFTLDGFSTSSIVSTAFVAVGLTLATLYAHRTRALVTGMVLTGLGDGCWAIHNTFLDGTRAWALGNWIFLTGIVFLVVVARMKLEEGADRVVTA